MGSGMAGENLEIFMENKLNPACAAKHANILSCISQQADGGGSLPTLSTAETTVYSLDSVGTRQTYHTRARAVKEI